MSKKQHNYDAHWKTIVTNLFEEFVAFFIPSIYSLIDFSVLPISLQHELEKITQDDKAEGKIINDKLFKVKLKDGSERWVLIHIEIQSYKEDDFPIRMFKYSYRIFDLYKEVAMAMAVYTGKERPKVYDHCLLETPISKINYQFKTYWVEEADEEELKASDNPFALVVLAAKYLNKTKTKKQGIKRLEYKVKLITLMKEKHYTPIQIQNLLTFIEFMLILPDELELEFEKKFIELYKTETEVMEVRESTKRLFATMYEKSHGISVEERIEQVQQETELKTKIESARKLLKKGLSPNIVGEGLDLSIERVLAIQANL